MMFFVIDSKNSATGRVCQMFCKENGTTSRDEVQNEGPHQGVKVNTMAGLVVSVIQVCNDNHALDPLFDHKIFLRME